MGFCRYTTATEQTHLRPTIGPTRAFVARVDTAVGLYVGPTSRVWDFRCRLTATLRRYRTTCQTHLAALSLSAEGLESSCVMGWDSADIHGHRADTPHTDRWPHASVRGACRHHGAQYTVVGLYIGPTSHGWDFRWRHKAPLRRYRTTYQAHPAPLSLSEEGLEPSGVMG